MLDAQHQNLQSNIESSGFSIDQVTPPSHADRVSELESIIADQNVPFPVSPAFATDYLKRAAQGEPFRVGSLTDLSVDLQGFEDEQLFEQLQMEEHLSWAQLIQSQQIQKQRYASREYLKGEQQFAIRGTTIPDYYLLNARIYQQTGWQLATVSKIIPANVFFHCHSRKFFPVTTFMRPLGCPYLEEPDIGHDIAGHVATFTIPEVAWVMNQHGLANEILHREKHAKLKKSRSDIERENIQAETEELLMLAGRIYWFTVEFGLVMEFGELKAFGAGILSSPGETRYSIESPVPNRIVIDVQQDRDLLRLATTDYLISEFQKTYFVMRDFHSLKSLTAERIIDTVKKARRLPHFTWREIAPGDTVYNVGKSVVGPNEKYFGLQTGQPHDECLARTAKRNLALKTSGVPPQTTIEHSFLDDLPDFPEICLRNACESNSNETCEVTLSLAEFVEELKQLDGPADLGQLKKLLSQLNSKDSDLQGFRQFDNDGYQRNLIAESDHFELLLLCFESGQRTPIHDHAGSACGVKVIEGTATETSFLPNDQGWLVATGSTQLSETGVVGSNDMDIHQLCNLQAEDQPLVTLHVYSPPLGTVGNYSTDSRHCQQVTAARNQ